MRPRHRRDIDIPGPTNPPRTAQVRNQPGDLTIGQKSPRMRAARLRPESGQRQKEELAGNAKRIRHGSSAELIKRRRLKPKERAEAIRRLKAGGQIKSVAEALDVGRETIRKIRDAELHQNAASAGAAQPITVRVAPAEAKAFEAAIGRAGYKNRSDGLRALVRMATGFLELPGDEGVELDALSRELNKIGVNINQMARLANSGRLQMNGRQMEEFRALHSDVKQLRTFLVQMNTERRRRGVALFLKQAEADNG